MEKDVSQHCFLYLPYPVTPAKQSTIVNTLLVALSATSPKQTLCLSFTWVASSIYMTSCPGTIFSMLFRLPITTYPIPMCPFKNQHTSHVLHKPSLITIALTAHCLPEILGVSLPIPVRSHWLINTDSETVPIQALHFEVSSENRNLPIMECHDVRDRSKQMNFWNKQKNECMILQEW